MPQRASLFCQRCRAIVPASGCPTCKKRNRLHAERHRASSCKRGYGRPWRAMRAVTLEQPDQWWCPVCLEDEGRYVYATVVDHIVPHRGNADLFNDPENLQGLCKRHHDQKTARGE